MKARGPIPRLGVPFGARADVAQLVEHHLAKVGVAGSNPVVRSRNQVRSPFEPPADAAPLIGRFQAAETVSSWADVDGRGSAEGCISALCGNAQTVGR